MIDVKNGKLTLSIQDEQVSFDIFKTVHLRDRSDTCFSIESMTNHENDTIDNPCFHPPPATSKAESSFSLKMEVHDQQPAPKFAEVDLKAKVKKKSKNGKTKYLSFFRKYGRLVLLDGDQRIKASRKKIKRYINDKINALRTTNILKDPG